MCSPKWLDAKSVRLSPVTVDRYKVAINHIEPAIGSMRVARLRPHHIEDLYDALLSKGQSGASIRKVHWALRQSLAWAHRRGYTAIVATDGIELPALGERKIQPSAETAEQEETSATRPEPAGPVTMHDPVFWATHPDALREALSRAGVTLPPPDAAPRL